MKLTLDAKQDDTLVPSRLCRQTGDTTTLSPKGGMAGKTNQKPAKVRKIKTNISRQTFI